MNTRRLLNVIGAGVAAGVLSGGLAACGSDTPTPVKGAAAPAPGGSSPAGSESPGGGESGTPGTGSKPGAASPGGTAGAGRPTRTGSSTDRCHSSQLRASIGRGSPGAGQRNFPLVLTNISSQTCTLHGFPGAGFFAAEGGQIGADPVRTGGAGSLFRLAPGRSAWAGLSFLPGHHRRERGPARDGRGDPARRARQHQRPLDRRQGPGQRHLLQHQDHLPLPRHRRLTRAPLARARQVTESPNPQRYRPPVMVSG
ncbi:DUF4232 domain-containing protein [Actinomadura yumaensis]|uniref:DUF4232 domain-containing protein n=1 Tax=Actinomadura yumaensis TaxID=111807 RepID=UPI0036177FA2